MAHLAQEVVPHTGIEHVIVTELADMHGQPKRLIMNAAVKYIKKMVPPYRIPGAKSFVDVMNEGGQVSVQACVPKT